MVGWLGGNARALWPNGWMDRVHFWNTGYGGHRNIVLDGHPNRPRNRGVRGPKFEVQWEGIGKRSSDRVEI